MAPLNMTSGVKAARIPRLAHRPVPANVITPTPNPSKTAQSSAVAIRMA